VLKRHDDIREVKQMEKKRFLTALGALLVAFGAVKLVLALCQRRREKMDGAGEPEA